MTGLDTSLLLPMLVQTLMICALAFIMGGPRFVSAQTRKVAMNLAWTFVSLRLIHMIWHNTKNIIVVRFIIFVASGVVVTWMLVLALMAVL